MTDFATFNKRAMQCSNHRMVMLGSESFFKRFDYQQIVPEKEITTYQCVGDCKQQIQYTKIQKP